MRALKRVAALCGVVVALTGAAVAAQAAPGATPASGRAVAPASVLAAPARSLAATATTPTVKPSVTVAAVGDLMFDHAPRRLIAAHGGKAPLVYVASQLRKADLTIANLEGPLSNRGPSVAGKPSNLIFEGDPRAIKGLTASGIDIVALANNHAMDHERPALSDTLKTLDKAKIAHAGAGMNVSAAWKPAIVKRNGATIAYLSFTDIVPSYFTAGKHQPGVAVGFNMARVAAAIRSARKKADYVIVAFHWGIEKVYTADSQQKRDARACIRAGADMVLSHHPHVVQGFEFYHRKLIAYSLGNFVFNYLTTEGRKSVILNATLTPSGTASVTVTPVFLGEWGRPKPVTGAMARDILTRVRTNSRRLGTSVKIAKTSARLMP